MFLGENVDNEYERQEDDDADDDTIKNTSDIINLW